MAEEFDLNMDETMSSVADKFYDEGGSLRDALDTADATEDTSEDTAGDAEEIEAEGADDAAEADESADADDEADDGDEQEEGAADEALAPPERWSASDKEAFAALPREAQELVLKRESDVAAHLQKETQKLSAERQAFQAVDNLISERRDAWAMEGMTPDQAVSQLFAISDYATRDPQGFLSWFAQTRGIQAPDQTGVDEYADPEIKAVKAELSSVKQTLQQREHAEMQARQAELASAIEQVASDKDAHPYFDELQGEITAILPSVNAQNPNASPAERLRMAYQKAVWANDNTRQRELEKQSKATEAQRVKAAKEAAKKAGRVLNVKGKGSPGVKQEPRSIDETLQAAYDRATGAA